MYKKNNSFFTFFYKNEEGITLIELLLVIALIVVLATLSMPVYSNLQTSSQLAESTSLLVQTLRTAKEKSSARLNDVKHGVKLEANSYILYYGSSYTTRIQSYDRTINLEGIDLSWSLSGTGQPNEINFSKGLSLPDMTGTITLINKIGKIKNITINEIGKIEQ